VTLQGRVAWLYHSSPRFSAGLLLTDDARRVRFRGPFLLQVDERVTLIGRMTKHHVYGEQFDAQRLTYDLALEPAGLAQYLANNPAFHGIGPAKAERIAVAFGSDFDRVIREEPARVRDAAQLTEETLATLREAWLARTELNALASWLAAYGLTHYQLTKIVERFGHQAKTLLMADPYLLCREVEGFGFARTDGIALKLGVNKTHPGRIAAALRDLVGQALEDGHCWVERDALVQEAVRVLALDTLEAYDQVAHQLQTLLRDAVLVAQSDGMTLLIALPWVLTREADLAQWLQDQGRRRMPGIGGAPLQARIAATGIALTPRQREAVKLALSSRLCLIVGAAGSGKSYTIAAVHEMVEATGRRVALCAPTGKAAKRLEEVTGCRAQTLHRLLGYNGRAWAASHEQPLDYDVVIVDEVSMVDIELAWRLFDAIDFSRTQVVLVGDHQQLPPVGAGNLLRDLLQYDYLPVCVLDRVIRQAGTLKENSAAILRGQLAPTAPGVPGTARPWYVIDTLQDPDAVVTALCELVRQKLPALGFDPVRDVQILTPYRKGPLGAQRLNLELQRVVQLERYGRELPPVDTQRHPVFYPGDKVMQTRNNYAMDVMNGAIGVIDAISVAATEDGAQRVLVVDFDGQRVQIPVGSDAERELTLAYATTVHKAQGSEYPCVVAILHRQHAYMLHRNLLYTAVTRARNTAILFGDRTGMRRAVTTTTVDERRTWLSLWGTPRATVPTPVTTEEEELTHA